MKNILTIIFLLPLILFAQYPVTDKQMVFQEQFDNEYASIKNGAELTDIVYSYGQATFNGTSSKANYNLNLNGVYTVRIVFTEGAVASKYLLDFRNSGGTGYVWINTSSIISIPSGIKYVNGIVANPTLVENTNYEVVLAGMSLDCTILWVGVNSTGGGIFFNKNIDLLEIYEGTLTASQVENMFLGRTLIPFPQQVNEQSLQLLSKIESSQGVIYDVMGNTIVNTNVETIDIGQTEVMGFNSVDSKLDLGVLDNTGNITTCGWIYANSMGEGNAGHIYSDYTSYGLYIAASKLKLTRDGAGHTAESASIIDLREWLFYCTTSTGAGVTNIYIGTINTAPLLSGSADQVGGTPFISTSHSTIGNRSINDRTWDGYINKPTIVSGIMTLQQITQIWSESKQYLK